MRAVVSALVFCVSTSVTAQAYRVTGTVTAGGVPVAGARVTIASMTLTSAADGRFATELPASRVDITVDAAGYAQTELRGVPIDRDTEMRLVLRRSVRITGRVTGGDTAALQPLRAYSLSRETEYAVGVPDSGEFTIELPADVYAIHARDLFPRLRLGHTRVDARERNVSGVQIALTDAGDRPMQLAPPIASKISVYAADAEGMATATGAAGATEGLSAIAAANLHTNHFVTTVSAPDGSFSLRLFAPPGSVLEIKHDPLGYFVPRTPGSSNVLEGAAGTLVYVPVPAGRFATMGELGQNPGGTSISVAEAIGAPASFWVQATGEWSQKQLSPSQGISLSGTLSLFGKVPIADPSALKPRGGMQAHRYFDAAGRERRFDNDFVSGILTPTGLPIGHASPRPGMGVGTVGAFTRVGDHYEAPFTITGRVPDDMQPGWYRFELVFFIDGLPPAGRSFDVPPSVFTIQEFRPMSLPPVRIGTPAAPKMAWALGMRDFSNGTHGAIALEDRGSWAIANHIVTNSDTFILAKDRYRLEPFAPMTSRSAGNGVLAEVPHLALRYPSGSLRVTVRKPDGSLDDLGSAPIAQAVLSTPITRAGNTANAASFHGSDFLQLSTLDPRFDYEFTQYGRHVISMTGTVEDLDGNVYAGGGTYEVWIAKALDLETAVLPGTPFEEGDAFTSALIVQPGVPAYVEVAVQLRGERSIDRRFTGYANRFGFFGGETMRLEEPGEYRVDVTARYLDRDGVLWMGAQTFGGVVATPNSALVTHGRRGFDLADGPQPQWFRVPEARTGGDHVMFPFNSGDIMWMTKFDPAADIPKISIQDPVGTFADRVRARSNIYGAKWEQPFKLEDRITAGEIPLFSTSSARTATEPETIDVWGYFYGAASRPGVRVREIISGDHSPSGYWRFTGDNYAFQPGTGTTGDLPNDFKFQFGGAVYRDERDGFRYYGGYASLFVLLPEDDFNGRVFPPFDANGGPILRLKGKDVDLFFHPTALRAGSILVRGEPIVFAGYAAPTLRSQVQIELIAPSGAQHGFTADTNAFGYLHWPVPFTADESGVWRMRVKITNTGPTSAGPLQPPYPTGNVLGSREGEMYFYVVDPEAPAALVDVPAESRPALYQPVAMSVSSSEALSNRELTYTVAGAGYILEEGTNTSRKYTYDLANLSTTFPNLDRFDADGRFAVDTVTMSFFLSGIDAKGARVFRARQVLLQGEELLAPEQNPVPPVTRRRSAR